MLLTHWGQDKTATISRHFQIDFLEWELCISIKISLKFVPKGPINNIPALLHHLNQWWFVYWRIYASLVLNKLTLYKINYSKETKICLSFLLFLGIIIAQVIQTFLINDKDMYLT